MAGTESQALTEAKRTGKPVQVLSKTGYTQEVVANPDGTFSATIAVGSIRTPKAGHWVPIDTRLVRKGDAWVPAAAAADVAFSAGGDGPFAWMQRGGRRLALTWPYGKLPTPTVDNDTATYQVFKDVDLQVVATADGFSHRIVVKTAAAAKDPRLAKVDFGLNTSTVSLKTGESGDVRAVDPHSGGLIFQASAPVMWEAAKRQSQAPSSAPRSASPVDPAPDSGEGRTAPVKATADKDALTLEPDKELLRDPKATFPLIIDPEFRSPMANKWAMISDNQPTQINFPTEYKDDGKTRKGQGVGYCNASGVGMGDCGNGLKKRLLFQFPSSVFGGYNIISSEFEVYQTANYNDNLTPVELWLTKMINSKMTWANSSSAGSTGFWQKKLLTFTSNKGFKVGPGKVSSAGPALLDTTQRAADGYWSTITLGLKSPDEANLTYWKRFQGGSEPLLAPVLRVQYNLPPNQPETSELKTISEGSPHTCRALADPAKEYVRKKTDMRLGAYLRDTTAASEQLKGEFEIWWDGAKQRTYWTDEKPKGSWFETESLDSLAIPENKDITWRVRAWDLRTVDSKRVLQGHSAWSNLKDGEDDGIAWHNENAHWCAFVYDHTKPPKPQVKSLDGRYPKADPQDTNAPWSDGVGMHGRFQFSPGVVEGRPVDKLKGYWYDDGRGKRAWVAAAADGTAAVDVLPETLGRKALNVQAVDLVDNLSETEPYNYRVDDGKPNTGAWPLDAPRSGDPEGELRDESGNGHPAYLRGDARVGPQRGGKVGESLLLDGNGDYAETAGEAIDPTKSFSVSAWAKLTKDEGYQTVTSQDGQSEAAFQLEYVGGFRGQSGWTNKWAVVVRLKDAKDSEVRAAFADDEVKLGEWVHLAGVYDSDVKTIRLYVNGRPQGSPVSASLDAWTASRGKFALGRTIWQGLLVDNFNGEIDDVHAFNRVITDAEVQKLWNTPPQVKAWWKLSNGTDEIDNQHPLSLAGNGATYSPPAQSGQVGDGKGGLRLPAASSVFASTSGPVVNTQESFSITGWATPDHNPNDDPNNPGPASPAAVFSQAGSINSAFTVRWHPKAFKGSNPDDPESPTLVDKGGWQIEMPDKDQAAGVIWSRTYHPDAAAAFGEKPADHLALVYDATSDTMTLYVNGAMRQRVSEVSHVVSFAALKEFRIGATRNNNTLGEFFPGLIDDVWAFQGALGGGQVACLAGQTEQQSPTGCLAGS
jgi:hypothetical protein